VIQSISLHKAPQAKENQENHFPFFLLLEEWVHIVSSGTYHPGLQDLNFNFFLPAMRVVVTLKNITLLPSRDVPFTRSNICQETDRFVIARPTSAKNYRT